MEKTKIKKILINLLKGVFTLFAGYYVLSNIDMAAFGRLWRHVNYGYLLVATVAFALSKVSSSFRLTIYWKNISVLLDERKNLKLYLLGMFYNLFLPGGIGGDAYKVWLLHKHRYADVKPLTMAVLIDRINGMVAILIMLLAVLFFLPLPVWVKGCIVPAIVGGYLIYCLLIRYFFPAFRESVHTTTLYSMFVQLLQCVSIVFIMKAIGMSDHYPEWMFVFMLSSVVAVLPFTIGGLGARELVFLYCSGWWQIDGAVAVSISLFFYLITALVSFSGVYYYFFPDRMAIGDNLSNR